MLALGRNWPCSGSEEGKGIQQASFSGREGRRSLWGELLGAGPFPKASSLVPREVHSLHQG